MNLLAVALLLAPPQDSPIRTEFESVLRAAPIEVFDSVAGATVVRGALLADVDADGTQEGVVWIRPGFRQTPTVLLFRRSSDGHWTRVTEGLAPGRFTAVSGRLRDSHALGAGVDLTGGDGGPAVQDRILAAASASRMSVVAYQGFLHGDARTGATFIVDLQKWPLPKGTDKTCESFEFSAVDVVDVGPLEGGGAAPYLVALTPEDVTIYRIASIAGSGRLTATSVLRPREADVTGLGRDAAGRIVLMTSGGTRPVPAP